MSKNLIIDGENYIFNISNDVIYWHNSFKNQIENLDNTISDLGENIDSETLYYLNNLKSIIQNKLYVITSFISSEQEWFDNNIDLNILPFELESD